MKKKKRYNGFFKFCAYVMTMVFMLPAWITTRDLITDGIQSSLAMFILAIASWGFVVSCGVFIIIGAGEKDGSGKIHLAHADNLFTEFWIFATAAFIGGLYSLNDLVIENMDSQSMAYQVLTMLIVETGTLIFLISMAGVVRRLKGGVFYKNSLTGLISKEIVKTQWSRTLNAVWRVTLLWVI
ncbi:MAG: hypothetical protein LIO46_03435 [Clostridiales bacterium]|nr:hypothetical protein [Clostridiales bacterium]